MKKIKFSVVVSLVLVALLVLPVSAAVPGSGWVTNIQVQNIGTGQASILITSYGPGGPFTSVTKNADPGASATFLASELGVSSGFQGAGVLSSDQPVFAIMFVTNYGTGTANTASAISRGIGSDKTATTLSFPLAKKRWGSGAKTTTFYVQNTGSAATTITATFASLAGACTSPVAKVFTNVASNTQVNFTPADTGCPNGSLGSVTVVGEQPLAGLHLEHDDDLTAPAGGTRVVQGTTGFSPSDYDTKLIAPIIKKAFGANKNVTGLQVQNVSGAEIPVGGLVVTYTVVAGPMGAGTKVTESNTAAIPDKASFNSLHAVLQDGTLASAEVAVVNPAHRIVGIVNENRPGGTTVFRNTTYSTIPAKDAATKVSLPLVKEYFGGGGGRCTGVQVFAVGGTATMKLTYKSGTSSYGVQTNSAVQSKTFLRISDPGATPDITLTGGTAADFRGKNFGVTAESLTPGVTLVAVANESFCPASTRDEDDANYEGFALP